MTEIVSNGNFDVWVGVPADFADVTKPTPAEINGLLRVTGAGAWNGTTFPNPSTSTGEDDRGWEDSASATEEGPVQYTASPAFFYPKNVNGTDILAQTWNFHKQDRVEVVYITRVLQRATAPGTTPATAGDVVNVYVFTIDAVAETTPLQAYKYGVELKPAGRAYFNVIVTTPSAIDATLDTVGMPAGVEGVIKVALDGKDVTRTAEFASSDPLVSVTRNGVVTLSGVLAADATITITHPATATTDTVTIPA